MQLLNPSLQLKKKVHQFLDRRLEFLSSKNKSLASAKVTPLNSQFPFYTRNRRGTDYYPSPSAGEQAQLLLHDHQLRHSITCFTRTNSITHILCCHSHEYNLQDAS